MGRSEDKCDYESLREARISENKARMELLGLHRHAGELSLVASPPRRPSSDTPKKAPRPRGALPSLTPLRRSARLVGTTTTPSGPTPTPGPRRSARLTGQPLEQKGLPPKEVSIKEEEEEKKKAIKAMVLDPERVRALQERRCESRDRGSVYDSVLGICCHFCRQKKLCGEEDCKRCGEGDLDQPCTGKTECSSCHSSNGILCRACLKVRYGEEMEEVRKNKNWMCPHCIEEKGINRFWICNSSICLKKRKMTPTGIAIYDAREQGYESVAHLLMDKLKRKAF